MSLNGTGPSRRVSVDRSSELEGSPLYRSSAVPRPSGFNDAHQARAMRRTTFIDPYLGRLRIPFTLRGRPEITLDAEQNLPPDFSAADSPWLHSDTPHPRLARLHYVLTQLVHKATDPVSVFLSSSTGQSVLKCSIAYLLASLATFVPQIGSLIGKGDGKHVVATVTVYFHPARSAGSMIEAIGLATLSFLYAAAVTVTSSAVSAMFGRHGLLYIGYAIVLLLFCGGGLGVLGWVKQKFQDPLINVACSLASLAIVSILTKEGHVQSGVFSTDKIVQVLKMIIMGITISGLVSFFLNPISARYELRKHLVSATDSLKSILVFITDDFSRGVTDEASQKQLATATEGFKKSWAALKKLQNEARYEHYLFGTVREHNLYGYLIDSIETLGQDLGGLRSASTMLLDLIKPKDEVAQKIGGSPNPSSSTSSPSIDVPHRASQSSSSSLHSLVSLSQSPPVRVTTADLGSMLAFQNPVPSPATLSAITPVGGSFVNNPDAVPLSHFQSQHQQRSSDSQLGEPVSLLEHPSLSNQPAHNVPDLYLIPNGSDHAFVFAFFISHLGPPMKSLAHTMELILRKLPCGPTSEYIIDVDSRFRPSLDDALELFTTARASALQQLRQHKIERSSRTVTAVADYEEVAAGCGHFSSSLEDFAEDLKVFVDILTRIQEVGDGNEKKSWDWLKFWRFRSIQMSEDDDLATRLIVPSTKPWKTKPAAVLSKKRDSVRYRPTDGPLARRLALMRYRLWQALRFFRRDDIKYAFKVGIGAIMYAVWSFVPATRPIYAHFRGEWGLVSYMLVCSMMVGASNTTAWLRVMGTLSGAGIAIAIWLAAHENPLLLALFGWMMSFICFYVILGWNQGPVGRYVLLTYNLSALYAYSVTIQDRDDDDDDETAFAKAAIVEIVFHRVVSVIAGCLWGIVITRLLWPIRARRKLRDGLAVLWLRISMMWSPDPLNALLAPYRLGGDTDNLFSPVSLSMTESIRLQRHLDRLETIRAAARNEITLKGPFRDDIYGRILDHSSRIVDAFYALNVLLTARRRPPTTTGEKRLLTYTAEARTQLSTRIGHLFSVLASSVLLGYPSLPSAMPKTGSSRDRLLARLYQFRYNTNNPSATDLSLNIVQKAEDADYEMFYAYSLITGQLGADLEVIIQGLEELFGELDEETIVLWD